MISRAGLKRVLEWLLGTTLILVGIAGLVLPGVQGVLLILAGLAVLSSHSRLARRILDASKEAVQRLRRRWRR